MKKIFWLAAVVLIATGCSHRAGNPRILVFTKTAGFRHASIAAGVQAIYTLGTQNNFDVDTTSDAAQFEEAQLKKYSAVVFLHTTGNLLNAAQEADFERYIQAGGGFVGIHAAADAEYDWGWYGRLVGGYFNGHPEQQVAVLHVHDSTYASTEHLPHAWRRKDEWYNFKKLNPDATLLLTIDEKSYHGGTHGESAHPMAWQHAYDGGRAWYTALGHTDESFAEPEFLRHLLGGIEYAIGDNLELNYRNATSPRVPEEERFTKTMLGQGAFFEPTEMTVLPSLDILVAQRRGEILLYKNGTGIVKPVANLNVYWKTEHTPNVNAEEGLLGIQADPDFAANGFVYVFYSPADTSVNRLSRFTFANDSIDLRTEKIILEFYSQREICCHTGGSIAFGPDRTLFVSTGDNTTPFDEPHTPYASHGYGPMDDRPGHMQYDARRGAGNTNDLRGKILRIRINADGTYTVPEGNLFPEGKVGTRPEIYVMGNRNPYRISVDKTNGYLYWGEVGPDASNDSLDTRGPRGYDEINQARQAGFYGWPFFVGNNFAYHLHNYQTNDNGPAFDVLNPVNNSRNNTGLPQLPPAQGAFIWYPYKPSPDFPQLGNGGRCAMGGPAYHMELYPEQTRMPAYYNNKVFIYDFTRGWFKAVTLQPNGDFDKMEPFMEHTAFNAPIDAELGPDGKLYILEYGNGWFTRNTDSGIGRIDFNPGNVPPAITALHVEKTSGMLPLPITAILTAHDLERDSLRYRWSLGDGQVKETTVPTLHYNYTTAGEFTLSVTAIDAKGATSKAASVTVYAGNEVPRVSVNVEGNQSFYFPGKPVQYSVRVEDNASGAKGFDTNSLVVTANYQVGHDKAGVPPGHQVLNAAAQGRNVMLSLDCKTCHKVTEKSIGPSFASVAQRYRKDEEAMPYLVKKILQGGGGVWGETAMPAHPALKEDDARQIVQWIQTLVADEHASRSLPPRGTVNSAVYQPDKDDGVLIVSASYTNQGSAQVRPLTGSGAASLRNSKVAVTGGVVPVAGIALGSFDLRNIASAELSTPAAVSVATPMELRLDDPQGKPIGTFMFASGSNAATVRAALTPVNDGKPHRVFLVSKNTSAAVPVSYVRFIHR